MKHIGITGTRRGGTAKQLASLRAMLFVHYDQAGTTLHMGDCIGIDEESVRIARQMGYRIHSHPPIIGVNRAFVAADEYEIPRPYSDRNRYIVSRVSLLIACPSGADEQPRSGTWSTIHKAAKLNKPIICIFPSGRVIPWT